jgi:dolichol-phosphate mannosyltransferase
VGDPTATGGDRVVMVIPTYDEADNIEALVRAALEQLEGAGVEHTILIVDDNSPDGTGRIADAAASATLSSATSARRSEA